MYIHRIFNYCVYITSNANQVEEKLVARDLAGEAAVKEAAPPAHLPLIVDFRSTCMAKVDAFDFDAAASTAEVTQLGLR